MAMLRWRLPRPERHDVVGRAPDRRGVEDCEALVQLTSRVQQRVGRHDHVRLLGIDRFGIRFRVQSRSGCVDLRVPFAEPLDGPTEFRTAVGRLLTCRPA